MINDNGFILEIKDLKKVYSSGDNFLTVLEHLNLKVRRGEIISIVGKSGSGKSTLLNLIGGLDLPTEGSIILKDKTIEKSSEEELSEFRNRNVGFIFQFHHLLSEFTALENVMIPYLIRDFDVNEAYKKSIKLFKTLEIYEKIYQKPNSLSGGESQRVAIARALINEPEIILADEPTGNLDIRTGDIIKDMLFQIVRKYNYTMIIATHNKALAREADITYELIYGFLNPLMDRPV